LNRLILLEMFLGSTGTDLFLRPDLHAASRRAQGWSGIAEGDREAARSVLDQNEHDGTIEAGGPNKSGQQIMVAANLKAASRRFVVKPRFDSGPHRPLGPSGLR